MFKWVNRKGCVWSVGGFFPLDAKCSGFRTILVVYHLCSEEDDGSFIVFVLVIIFLKVFQMQILNFRVWEDSPVSIKGLPPISEDGLQIPIVHSESLERFLGFAASHSSPIDTWGLQPARLAQ